MQVCGWVGEGGCRARMFKPSGQCMWAVNCVNDSTHMFFWHSRPSGDPPTPPTPSHTPPTAACVKWNLYKSDFRPDTDLMESVFPDKQGLCYVSLWLNLQILVQTASRRWSSGFESCWWTESWGATLQSSAQHGSFWLIQTFYFLKPTALWFKMFLLHKLTDKRK